MHFPIRTVACAVALAFATLTPATAAAQPAAPVAQPAGVPLPKGVTRVHSVEGITEYRLGNGLRILLAADASKPNVTVNLTYLVGSRHENYGETGMAHLLEHLQFKGTATRTAEQLWEGFKQHGINKNATTSHDRTNYFGIFAASDEALDWILGLEADRMVNSLIRKQDLDSEMTVVRNEMEASENQPGPAVQKQALAAAFNWHNYGKLPIGARSDVENVKIERLQAFYRRYYQPDNAVLAVTGKIDEAKTLALIVRHFGALPRPTRTLEPTYTREPTQEGAREVTVERVGDTQLLTALYHAAPVAHPDHAADMLAAYMLGDVPNGRLHKALVETGLASAAAGGVLGLAESSLFSFSVVLDKRQSRDKAREAMVAVLESVKAQPFTEEELKRAKLSQLNSIEKLQQNQVSLTLALSEAITQGDWRLLFLLRDRIEAAKLDEVQRAAERYLRANNRTIGQFVPVERVERAEIPAVPDLAAALNGYVGRAAIAAGEDFDTSPANIDARTERVRLDNGMKLALLPKATRGDTVNGVLTFSFGDEKSLHGRGEIGELTAAMLKRGAGSLDRRAIDARLEELKARVGFSYSAGRLTVHFDTRRDQLPQFLELLQTLLRQPTFPAGELAQLKQLYQTSIDASRAQPGAVADQALARHDNPYPAGDPRYAASFDEIKATLGRIEQADLQKFHRDFFGIDRAELALVGSFDAAAAKVQIAKLFGDWKNPAPYRRIDTPFRATKPASFDFETPDKANAEFRATLALPIGDDSADYPAVLMATHILGGGPGGRLFKQLRGRDGLSYGIYAGLQVSSEEKLGTLVLSGSYAPENLAKLRAGVAEVVGAWYRDGVTEAELAASKAETLKGLPMSRANDGYMAGVLAGQLSLGRDMRFDAELERKLAALTVAEVNAAIKRYFDPTQLAQAYAGDFAGAARRVQAGTVAPVGAPATAGSAKP